jgi:hypothetical protein
MEDESAVDNFADELEECVVAAEASGEQLEHLDEELHILRELARRPCARGGSYGIVGNAGVVLRARYLTGLVEGEGFQLRAGWRSFVWGADGEWDMPEAERVRHQKGGKDVIVSFACPKCGEVI